MPLQTERLALGLENTLFSRVNTCKINNCHFTLKVRRIMANEELQFMHPYFLGAYAENDHIFEKILLEFFRDHAYWRRNFHPENRPPIPTTAFYKEDYNEFLAEMKQELLNLSADLKKSVPFFSPRYLGHMAADLLLPGVLAQMMTILYNPNNVSDDAAPGTLMKEIKVGEMLAHMVGFNTDPSVKPRAWGHLTSGGSVANYEGIWNLRAVKYYPVSLAEAAKSHGFEVEEVGPQCKNLTQYSKWELFNFSISEAVDLMHQAVTQLKKSGRKKFREARQVVMDESLDSLGMPGFFLKHSDLKPPLIIVPISAHYSWDKSAKILGMGINQVVRLNIDENMRMRADHLAEVLAKCHANEQAVLAVIGVLGSTEFGSVDPIHEVVALRDQYQAKGLFCGIHVDGAWGGYMSALFRMKDGSFMPHDDVKGKFKYFPQAGTWKAFKAVAQVDSVTVDPHKLGYLPFSSGAFISRNSGVLDFISQEAAYVFDVKDDPFKKPMEKKLMALGQYIMEGSKPGAAAAAAYVTHRVIPLHHDGFGKVLTLTMKACEYLFDSLQELADRLKNLVTLVVPYCPDTNLIVYAINPKRNKSLALMNHFSRKIFSHIKINPKQPLQGHHFFGSFTSLRKDKLGEAESERVLGLMGIDPGTFVNNVEKGSDGISLEADHIYMIRHTLMNPWLLHKERDDGLNYLDRFTQFLERRVIDELGLAINKSR